MGKTRTRKATLNLFTAFISELVALAVGFILPRLIIASFGSTYNGIVSSAKQFLEAIRILTLGVTGATRAALYAPLANNDIKKVSGIVRATERYMRKVGTVLAFYIALLAVLYPQFVRTGYGFWDVALLIIAAGLGTFGQYFFGTTYNAFLIADQSLYISYIFDIITLILNTTVSVALIVRGFSIQAVKLSSAVIFFIRPLLLNVYVTKKYKLDKHCLPDNSALERKNDVLAHALANMVHDNTDIIVLTVFTDVKIVSVYTVYNLVMTALKKVQSVLTSSIEPIFGDMWAKGESEKIKKQLDNCEYLVACFVSVVFSTTAVMILPFVRLYTKGVTDVEYVLPVYGFVITVAFALHCLRAPYLTLVQGAGKYKETKRSAIIEAVLNLVLSIILVQFIGIVGVAVGTLAANIFRTVDCAAYVEKNMVSRGRLIIAKRLIWTIGNILLIFFVSRITIWNIAGSSWLYWVLCASLTVLLSVGIVIVSSKLFFPEAFRSGYELINHAIHSKIKHTNKKKNADISKKSE